MRHSALQDSPAKTCRNARTPGIDLDTIQNDTGETPQLTDQLGGFTFSNLSEGKYELEIAESKQHYPVLLRVRAGVANAERVLNR